MAIFMQKELAVVNPFYPIPHNLSFNQGYTSKLATCCVSIRDILPSYHKGHGNCLYDVLQWIARRATEKASS